MIALSAALGFQSLAISTSIEQCIKSVQWHHLISHAGLGYAQSAQLCAEDV